MASLMLKETRMTLHHFADPLSQDDNILWPASGSLMSGILAVPRLYVTAGRFRRPKVQKKGD